jgi:hypothetical protein
VRRRRGTCRSRGQWTQPPASSVHPNIHLQPSTSPFLAVCSNLTHSQNHNHKQPSRRAYSSLSLVASAGLAPSHSLAVSIASQAPAVLSTSILLAPCSHDERLSSGDYPKRCRCTCPSPPTSTSESLGPKPAGSAQAAASKAATAWWTQWPYFHRCWWLYRCSSSSQILAFARPYSAVESHLRAPAFAEP